MKRAFRNGTAMTIRLMSPLVSLVSIPTLGGIARRNAMRPMTARAAAMAL